MLINPSLKTIKHILVFQLRVEMFYLGFGVSFVGLVPVHVFVHVMHASSKITGFIQGMN